LPTWPAFVNWARGVVLVERLKGPEL